MPPRNNPPPYVFGNVKRGNPENNNNNNNNTTKSMDNSGDMTPSDRTVLHERIMANESLLATESEKHATSKSLYGDPTARISSNVHNIHDRIRLRAYQSVLKSVKGKAVLHLGCGMGLISMMAARNLASVVVAVDHSAIVEAAQVVAEQNGLKNIFFFRGPLRDKRPFFPVQKFDVIMCEWVGAFLINDPLLNDALFARDNLLKEDGVICPDSSSIHIVGVSDYAFYLDTVDYWSNVYGFKMDPMKTLVRQEVETCSIPAANIVTSSCLTYTVNIKNINSNMEENGFTAPFSLKVTRDTTINFLTFFVDATFTNPHDPGANFVIGIRPGGRNLWTETSVGLEEPLPLKCGETLSGELRVRVMNKERGLTAIEVKARTAGGVSPIETAGSYIYQRC